MTKIQLTPFKKKKKNIIICLFLIVNKWSSWKMGVGERN